MRRTATRHPAVALLAAASLIALPAAWAQEAGEGDKLAEIIVTAQKREQNLQNVGTSITALDGETLLLPTSGSGASGEPSN